MMGKNTEIVYIDESNISSSTGNSVYVCLYINFLNKDLVGNVIVDIEKKLNIVHTHWTEMSWKLRLKFYEKIKNLNFVCDVVVYKNPINQEFVLEDFLFKTLRGKNNISKIIIDGKKGKNYEKDMKRILKNRGLRFKKIIFMNDKKEPCIRLADFVAGLIRSFLDNKNKDNILMYNALKHKIKILS